MKYQYTGYPTFVDKSEYQAAIERMVAGLISKAPVVSIFQIGGVGTPGVSDIDLYVVLKDGETYTENPVQSISKSDRYLFTHNLFGTARETALRMEQFTYFGKYDHLYGEHINMINYTQSDPDRELLKHQIALEYLIKAYISISIQSEFRVIKIRSLLLHAKALFYDLDFLGITTGNFHHCLHEIMEVRNTIFNKPLQKEKMDHLVDQYRIGLSSTISEAIEKYQFYMGPGSNMRIGQNIRISPSSKVEFLRNGMKLPHFLSKKNKLLQKANTKFNNFTMRLPVIAKPVPDIILKRQNEIAKGIEYNRKNLPGFLCTAYGMNIFLN